MQSERLLTTTGKMPVALKVKMNIFGLWPLNNFLKAATVLAAVLPRNLLLLARNLLRNPALKNPNNFWFFTRGICK